MRHAGNLFFGDGAVRERRAGSDTIPDLAMDANVWRRVEVLYYRVATVPAEERAALLDEACRGDPDLRREVEALLEARDRAGDFLSPEGLVRQIADVTPEP